MSIFGGKKRLNLGVIVGNSFGGYLSFDEYVDHFLLPFSPRFRNIDFSIATLNSVGVTDFLIFTDKDKEIVARYLMSSWPFLDFYVFDKLDLKTEFIEFFNEYANQKQVSMVGMINGGYPVWFNLRHYHQEYVKTKSTAFRWKDGEREACPLIVLDKNLFMKKMTAIIEKHDTLIEVPKFREEIDADMPVTDITDGYVIPFKSIEEYYRIHIDMIDSYLTYDQYNAYVPIRGEKARLVPATIARGCHFIHSIVGEDSDVSGKIQDSVIFSNVKIAPTAIVKNSIILPGNHIGAGAVIQNTIIDEFSGDNSIPNIERNVVIGNPKPSKRNEDYPKILNFGVTLIGKDVVIPARTEIGGNCYIESFVKPSKIAALRTIPDGKSILHDEPTPPTPPQLPKA
ncbi:MAG: hypothetical protein A2Y33_06870 [Spirochaetes bacterium GWF1_51_8]|nr:MAG: hypothetical protein A2Y33_06870 [Spirochaetes bacterium GWF1_51_8]